MSKAVRMPRLLDASFAEVRRVRPLALSLAIEEGVSTAQLTLSPADAGVAMHGWIELYTLKGSAGLFRVTGTTDKEKDGVTLNLRHGIDVLRDSVWKAQVDFDGTVPAFLSALLAQQTAARWQLGTCQDTAAFKHAGINYDKLSDLLEILRDERKDYYFTYDFSTAPWTLNFLQKPAAVACEFRKTRNIRTAQLIQSDGDMCNRLYLSVSHEETQNNVTKTVTTLHTYNNTASQAEYGIIEGTADIDLADVPDKDAWAAAFLAARGGPGKQMQIEGYELIKQTGEPWDQFDLCRLARAPLPGGGTLQERITRIYYPDLVATPTVAQADLARRLAKFSESLANLKKETATTARSARRSGRSAAKATNLEHWSQVVSHQQAALDGTGLMELYESGIDLDADEGVKLYSLKQGLQSFYADIKVNAQQISSRVLSSDFQTYVAQTDRKIEQKVTNGEVATALTVELGNVSVTGGNLVVDGYVKADALDATTADIRNILSGTTKASLIYTKDLMASDNITGNILYATTQLSVGSGSGTGAGGGTMYLNGKNVADNCVASFGTPTVAEDGRVSIPYTMLSGASGTINFTKAAEVDIPAANLTATPTYLSGSHLYSIYVRAEASNGASQSKTVRTGTEAWEAGWNAAADQVSPPGAGTGTGFSVGVPSTTPGGAARSYDFTITKGATPAASGYAAVVLGQTVVGRIAIGDWYTAGVNSVDIPAANLTVTPTYLAGSHVYSLYASAKASNGATRAATVRTGTEAWDAGKAAGEAEFTLATVTPQGESEAVYVNDSSGTNYYAAGTATTYYKGNGGSFTVQGSALGFKLKEYGYQQFYYLGASGNYIAVGSERRWFYVNAAQGTQYYNAGSTTKYARGDAVTVTPIGSTSIKVKSATRYKAGTAVSDTYYTKS